MLLQTNPLYKTPMPTNNTTLWLQVAYGPATNPCLSNSIGGRTGAFLEQMQYLVRFATNR